MSNYVRNSDASVYEVVFVRDFRVCDGFSGFTNAGVLSFAIFHTAFSSDNITDKGSSRDRMKYASAMLSRGKI